MPPCHVANEGEFSNYSDNPKQSLILTDCSHCVPPLDFSFACQGRPKRLDVSYVTVGSDVTLVLSRDHRRKLVWILTSIFFSIREFRDAGLEVILCYGLVML